MNRTGKKINVLLMRIPIFPDRYCSLFVIFLFFSAVIFLCFSFFISEGPSVMFCSPVVRTVFAGCGQRLCCQVTASSLVTIAAIFLLLMGRRSDLLPPLRNIHAMGIQLECHHKRCVALNTSNGYTKQRVII